MPQNMLALEQAVLRSVPSPFDVGVGVLYRPLIHHILPFLVYHMAGMYLRVLKI